MKCSRVKTRRSYTGVTLRKSAMYRAELCSAESMGAVVIRTGRVPKMKRLLVTQLSQTEI